VSHDDFTLGGNILIHLTQSSATAAEYRMGASDRKLKAISKPPSPDNLTDFQRERPLQLLVVEGTSILPEGPYSSRVGAFIRPGDFSQTT
jgi:hypothetical protein